MSQDDPFALPEEERTIIRPAPGGRRALSPVQPAAAQVTTLTNDDLSRIAALNPLLAAANALLTLAGQLRNAPAVDDLEQLRDTLVRSVREFETNAKNRGIRGEVVLAARYSLCTFLDEVIATTPWGAGGEWANRSLLVTFHNEAYGGDKFFALLKRVGENPAANVDLLELMYLCLAFGFQGKYRVLEGGRSELEELRERLYLLIRTQRGEPEQELSPRWRGSAEKRKPLTSWIPLWVAGAAAAGCLLVIYLAMSWALSRSSDPVYAALHDIPDKFAPTAPRAAAAQPSGLSTLLQPEITAGWVSVTELADRAIVRIRGDNLFQSGSATINPDYLAVLARVAEALNSTQGVILVTGHTDNRRMFSARFPSNWDLSNARADAVVAVLSPALAAPNRLRAEGRADREPIAGNDTPDQRALNRRVDITVFTGTLSTTLPGAGSVLPGRNRQ